MLTNYRSDGENSVLFSKNETELNLAVFEAYGITATERESVKKKVARAAKLYSDNLEAAVLKRLASND